ncbi:MAG: STAS/SEC14 domain-containing protein [Thermoflexales bacterium]|nr:STAS/SEC14 domain-containing protein [Thermoflexales bacterium]
MSYTLKLDNDGILHLTIFENFDKEDAVAYLAEAERLLLEHDPGTHSVYVLVDARQTGGKMDLTARKTITELNRRNQDGKVAILGVSPYVRVLVSLTSKVMGQDRVGFFGTEEEALKWLKSR